MKSKIVALSKNEDFKNLLKKKKCSNKYLTIFFGSLENKDNKKLNISFVAKKKQIGSAIKRNKVKRRLRNIVNDAVNKISINFNYSYLVIAKTTMLNNEFTIIKDTLFKDFKRIK
jgi:ribonuclease P protein component